MTFNRHWLALEQGLGGHASTAVLKRLGTYTAIFGIIHALLYFASYYFLQSIPLGSDADAQIADYYMNGDQRRLVIAGMYMMPFAGIFFLYFMVFLRTLAGSTGVEISSILSTVQLLAGTIFIGLLFTAAAASTSTAAGLQFANADMDPNFARQLPLFSNTLLVAFAMRMTADVCFYLLQHRQSNQPGADLVRLFWLCGGRFSAPERFDHRLVYACLPGVGRLAFHHHLVACLSIGKRLAGYRRSYASAAGLRGIWCILKRIRLRKSGCCSSIGAIRGRSFLSLQQAASRLSGKLLPFVPGKRFIAGTNSSLNLGLVPIMVLQLSNELVL